MVAPVSVPSVGPKGKFDLLLYLKSFNYVRKKARNRLYPARTITDADYADDIALLANTPTQAESLLYSLEKAAGGIGVDVNADKTRYKF